MVRWLERNTPGLQGIHEWPQTLCWWSERLKKVQKKKTKQKQIAAYKTLAVVVHITFLKVTENQAALHMLKHRNSLEEKTSHQKISIRNSQCYDLVYSTGTLFIVIDHSYFVNCDYNTKPINLTKMSASFFSPSFCWLLPLLHLYYCVMICLWTSCTTGCSDLSRDWLVG